MPFERILIFKISCPVLRTRQFKKADLECFRDILVLIHVPGMYKLKFPAGEWSDWRGEAFCPALAQDPKVV